ncbi:MAG: hypothetical protein RR415_06335 [Ruthenibacterium sp.]
MQSEIFKHEDPLFLQCNNIYFPFEAEKVEYSGFWMQPHLLYFGAQINLNVKTAGLYTFVLSACGQVKLFVNDVQQAQIYSYLRNQEVSQDIKLNLEKGENIIYVLSNDLAERDTQFYFKLKYTGEQDIEGLLPAKTNLKKLDEIRTVFAEMYFEKFNFQNKDIFLNFAKPIEHQFDIHIKLIFTDAHTKVAKSEKDITLQPGDINVFIGDLVYKEVGMVSVYISAKVEDVSLNRKIDFEYYNELIMPKIGVSTIQERKKAALKFASNYGLNDFQKAIAIIETDGDKALAQEIIDDELFKLNERYDCSDFRTPALVYAYKSSKFSAENKQKIKEVLLNFRYWFDENGTDVMWFFSENHALNFHASELLAGELFENEVFPNSGMTGAEHQAKAKRLLHTWFSNFFAHGFNEWNSSVYIPIDMIAFFALYDMVKDPEIKKLAKEALDKTFGIFGANSYKGIVAASYGRIYFKNLIGRRTSESTALNFIASGQGYFNQHCFATTLFALSSYEPSSQIMDMYYVKPEGKVTKSIEGEELVNLYSFKTPDYIMGSVCNYKVGKAGTQEHALQIMIKDCDTQIWINHPGEAAYFGEGRPSYFAGNGTLPLVEQNENYAKVTYNLLEQEVKYTHAFCPLDNFDVVQHMDKWIFLQKQNVYVAIYASNGITITNHGALKNYELISHGKSNFWQVLIDTDAFYESFDDFQKKVTKKY